jgi:hypothetical protein
MQEATMQQVYTPLKLPISRVAAMRCGGLAFLAILTAGCVGPGAPQPRAMSRPAAAAPMAQTREPPPAERLDFVPAALSAALPQCRAEILGFDELARLARRFGEEPSVFEHAINDMASQLVACIAAAVLAVAGPSASAQSTTTTTSPSTTTATKPPTSATPDMIAEAIQRSRARAAKYKQYGTPERFGSEEPFTYDPTQK